MRLPTGSSKTRLPIGSYKTRLLIGSSETRLPIGSEALSKGGGLSEGCRGFLSTSHTRVGGVGEADKLLKRRRGRKSALEVIKSTAVWLRRLEFECVMCWVNDAAVAAGPARRHAPSAS